MVVGYANTKDWVHLALLLGEYNYGSGCYHASFPVVSFCFVHFSDAQTMPQMTSQTLISCPPQHSRRPRPSRTLLPLRRT
jgi:hypothetical protein